MQLFFSDYTFVLLAVLVAGWLLSWWFPEQYRWYLLAAAAAVSVFCTGLGCVHLVSHAQMDPPKPWSCSPAVECTDLSPVAWIVGGLLGLGCIFVLLFATLAVGFIRERMGFGEVATLGRRDHRSRRSR